MSIRFPLSAIGLVASLTLGAAQAEPVHGLSAFGDLKYPADFRHFDWVNPDAPKGGTLALTSSQDKTSFDSLNRFINIPNAC